MQRNLSAFSHVLMGTSSSTIIEHDIDLSYARSQTTGSPTTSGMPTNAVSWSAPVSVGKAVTVDGDSLKTWPRLFMATAPISWRYFPVTEISVGTIQQTFPYIDVEREPFQHVGPDLGLQLSVQMFPTEIVSPIAIDSTSSLNQARRMRALYTVPRWMINPLIPIS